MKLRLTADEKKMLRSSAAAVREVVGVLKKRVEALHPWTSDSRVRPRSSAAPPRASVSGFGVAGRRGRERRHARSPRRRSGARGAAARRPRGRRRRHERRRRGACRAGGGRHLRRPGHPREQLGRAAPRLGCRARGRGRRGCGAAPPLSVVRLTSLCLPYLRKSETGRIVNVTSSTVREPIDNLALSNIVRPGVVGWAKSLARELGPDGITVNCIAPGRIDTERIREVYPDGPSDADSKPSRCAASERPARSATSWPSSARRERPT